MRPPFLRRTLLGLAAGALLVTQAGAPPMPVPLAGPAPTQDSGAGWDEVVCAACVGAGTLALLSGASGFAVLVANPSMTVGVAQVCIAACMRSLEDER